MAQDLVGAVRAAGVVGAGGAGFPTHVKLTAQVDTVIANGAECDPLLQCDQRLMESRATEMVRGVQLAMDVTGATRGILALKDEYGAAVAALRRAGMSLVDRTPIVKNEIIRRAMGTTGDLPRFARTGAGPVAGK